MDKNFIIIALGSNLGDKEQNLKNALLSLKTKVRDIKCSDIYASKALLPEGAPKEWDNDFYNSVFYGYTDLDLKSLFEFCLRVENEIGVIKKQKGSWGPRYMDIDIIAFNDEVVSTENLKIPHPRMMERNFVIYPLAEILPDWKYPVKGLNFQRTALEMAQNFGCKFPEEVENPEIQLSIKRLGIKLI